MKKEFLFIPRKGQITISILLIFIIVFSTFSFGLYASRQVISTVNFRNAVDAASLSAGADLAKGIGLFITLTGIRLVLFGVSIIVGVIGFLVPGAAGASLKIVETLPKVSHVLEYISRYIPVIYTALATKDAYSTFTKNLQDSGESTNDAHLIVVPKAFLENLGNSISGEDKINSFKSLFPLNVNYNSYPTEEDVKKTLDFLRKGFTIVAWKKRSFLKAGYEKAVHLLGEKPVISSSGFDINDYDVALIDVYPIRRSETGVSLGDALKISNFLVKYFDGGNVNNFIEQTGQKTRKDVKKTQCEDFVGSVESFINKSNGTISELPNNVVSCKNNLITQINNVENGVKDCSGNLPKGPCGGSLYNFEKLKDDVNIKFNKIWNEAVSINNIFTGIENATGYLKSAICGENTENVNLNNKSYEDFRARLVEIRDESKTIIGDLKSLRSQMSGTYYYAHEYVEHEVTDPKTGQTSTWRECENRCPFDFSTAISIIDGLIEQVKTISDNSNECIGIIDKGANEVKTIVDNGFGEILGKFLDDIVSIGTAFEGFPGGNILSFFASLAGGNTYKCNCNDEKIKTANGLLPGKIGGFICAVATDIEMVSKIIDGDKFDFISYYSPVLDEPDWLKNYRAPKISVDLSKENIQEFISDNLNGLVSNIKNDTANINWKSSFGEALINAGVGVVMGFFRGGPVGAIAGLVISILTELIEPVIVDKLLTKLTGWVSSKVEEILSGFDWNNLNSSFNQFLDNLNNFLGLPFRLLGKSDTSSHYFARRDNLSWLFCSINDKVFYERKLDFEVS